MHKIIPYSIACKYTHIGESLNKLLYSWTMEKITGISMIWYGKFPEYIVKWKEQNAK